ncbi:nitronate monooxygenase [Ottowia sp. GY511]|uniref:NAD(P)H-dependent flavin oxidoreductase n=1 Tax=Ottowia flava TaxID=2675430 RepID=A0ABW4KWL0_9BURK|nr:nitronate monooxygenase family protein [Ottowia sp. GY511]TXK23545.1 nitronate monooxygenase [Ottowia sp. GY511]
MTLQELKSRVRIPVIASPMFIVSYPELVIAQCKAGIIGSFPSLNARPAHVFEEWLQRITAELAQHDRDHPDRPSAPFAVNQIVHKTNDRLQHDLELCVKYKVPLIITSLGAQSEVNDAIHSYGGLVMHDVINQKFAHKAIEKGADGLIVVAAGAGGHAGRQSPFALMQETRAWFDGPIALSGSIANGASILAAQTLGADFAYVGSAFIATQEANARPEYQQAILEGTADDIVYTNFFTGVWGNYLGPSIVAAGLDPQNMPGADPSRMKFNGPEGGFKAKAWKDVWGCGQGIGVLHDIPTAGELVDRFANEYEAARARLNLRAA